MFRPCCTSVLEAAPPSTGSRSARHAVRILIKVDIARANVGQQPTISVLPDRRSTPRTRRRTKPLGHPLHFKEWDVRPLFHGSPSLHSRNLCDQRQHDDHRRRTSYKSRSGRRRYARLQKLMMNAPNALAKNVPTTATSGVPPMNTAPGVSRYPSPVVLKVLLISPKSRTQTPTPTPPQVGVYLDALHLDARLARADRIVPSSTRARRAASGEENLAQDEETTPRHLTESR